MKTMNEILDLLNGFKDAFDEQFAKKEYRRAAATYEDMLLLSGFIQLNDEEREALIARFDQEKVETAFKEAGLC